MLGTIGIKNGVDYTIINGEIVVERGHLARVKEEDIIASGNHKVEEYIAKN